MDLKDLVLAIEQIAEEKSIKTEKAIEAVEAALAAAYKKEYRNRSEMVKATIDLKTGGLNFSQVKIVVDPEEVKIVDEELEDPIRAGESDKSDSTSDGARDDVGKGEEEELLRYNPDRHIFLEEAKKEKADAEVGDEIEFPLEEKEDFGRIAAQTAKQVILQNIREAEKDSIREEFANKEGEIISGVVQRFERGNVHVDLGRAVGIMFHNESVPGEHYRVGQRMRFYVLAVQEEDRKRPGIILSRAHPSFVLKLFELEVPEIAEEVVEIKAIAREPGNRAKIAVVSHQDGIDPIGAVVGQRGTRVMAVTNELGNEKIDVTEWSEDPEDFIANALSPAKVKLVEILPRREAKVLAAEDQLSLAIGKSGQNVRLAAKLTGWKIDVRSQSKPDEVQEGGVAVAPEEGEGETEENQKEAQKEVVAEENEVEKSEKVIEEREKKNKEDNKKREEKDDKKE